MTETAKRQTAKIYQFPAGGRAGLDIRNDTGRGAENVHAKQSKIVLGGGCWYHDAAMKEGDFDNAG